MNLWAVAKRVTRLQWNERLWRQLRSFRRRPERAAIRPNARLPLTRDERPVVKRRTRKKLQYWAQGFIR